MKFKVGDRVIITDSIGTCANVGDTGTIISDDECSVFDYAVNIDRFDDAFHDCGGRAFQHHGQYVVDRNIRLLSDDDLNIEFKLIIVSKGDKTIGKLIRGKSVIKTCEVNRYYKDPYSEETAIRSVVDKIFPRDLPNKGKYLTAKVVCIESHRSNFVKGNIYDVKNGCVSGDDGLYSGITSEEHLNKISGCKFIILNED